MKLYLCEKQLQASDIASVLGTFSRHNGYFKVSEDLVVTWAKGHLLQLNAPEDYHPRYRKWVIDDLPISPHPWVKSVRPDSIAQLQIIEGLVKKASTVFIATDLDREGESIALEILERCRYSGPVKRIRLSALDEESIKETLADARDIRETASLADAADARQKADWLVGMNLTRLYTLLFQAKGIDETCHVGRVAIPTISLVCQREQEINAFESVPYFTLKAICSANGTLFKVDWVAPDDCCDRQKRCLSSRERESARQQTYLNTGLVTASLSALKKSHPPLPFDLNTLQSTACSRWNYTSKEVLKGLQSLYEKHNLITYPRTENRYLPSHLYAMVPEILKSIAYCGKTGVLITQGVVSDRFMFARVFDDERVSPAHHAIIPTRKKARLESLNQLESRLYLLICRYFVAQFYPVHLRDVCTVNIRVNDQSFRFAGYKTRVMGWKTVLGKNLALINKADAVLTEEISDLPELSVGDRVLFREVLGENHMTAPPEFFTEASLINAMKRIGRFVDDEELKKVLDHSSGIGTAGTRADIIETAVKRGYLQRDTHRKRIKATRKGHALISALPEPITSAGVTAQWEMKLERVAQGDLNSDVFVQEIGQWVKDLITNRKPSSPS